MRGTLTSRGVRRFGAATYVANSPPSLTSERLQGVARWLSEKSVRKKSKQRRRASEHFNPEARSSTSLLQTLRPWLALTPASTDATTTCPCPDHNMALYSLFKITALCALFQAASAAVRRQPPPP